MNKRPTGLLVNTSETATKWLTSNARIQLTIYFALTHLHYDYFINTVSKQLVG